MVFVGFCSTFVILLSHVSGDRGVLEDNVDNFIKAIQRRDFLEIEILADTLDMDLVDLKYSFGFLHMAIRIGDAKITRLLLSKGWDKVVNNVNRLGFTPLYALCKEKNQNKDAVYEIMEALLEAGADADFGDFGIATKLAPLHIVEDESVARLLISYGADVDAKNAWKRTPAYLSLLNKNSGVLKAVADGGANFSVADRQGDTIFHFCKPDFPMTKEIAILLAQKGAPLEALNRKGETPMTKFLKLDARMDRIRRMNWGLNPSRSGCDESKYDSNLSYGNLNESFYGCLLSAGADLNSLNGRGEGLIHIAVREFEADMVKWLLENGVDADCKNGKGDTPLLVLLKFQEPDYLEDCTARSLLPLTELAVFVKAVIKVLVNGAANLKATDKRGYDATHYLQKTNLTSVDNEIVHLLLKE